MHIMFYISKLSASAGRALMTVVVAILLVFCQLSQDLLKLQEPTTVVSIHSDVGLGKSA